MSRKTRNLIWSAPLVAVLAVAGALAIFMTLTPNSALAQAEEIPGMPMNLTSNALGPDSIELMWDAPTADTGGLPDGYRIDYSNDGMVWYSLEPNHNSTVFTDDTGLSAVQTRHYRVFAFNSGGSSAVLNGKSATTMKSSMADAPTGLDAVYPTADGTSGGTLDAGTATQTHIKLQWTAPSNPPGAPVTKYLIEVSKDGRAFTKLVERSAKDAGCTGTDTSCEYTHSGLLESQERWYRVTAYNYPNGKHAAAVASNASNTDSHKTAAGVIPAAIADGGVRVGLNPAGRMTLYWEEPDTTTTPLPGAPIIGYYVYGGNAATAATDVKKLHFVEANTSLVITSNIQSKFDVPSSTEAWNFQVMAVNSVVRRMVADGVVTAGTDGNWSTNVAVTADERAKNVTESPTDDVTNDLLNRPRFTKRVRVNNVNAGRTDIELAWVVEKVQAGTTYRLERSEDRIDWEGVTLATNTEETFTDTGRIAGTTYWYRVLADHNRTITSDNVFTEASTPVSVTTAPAGRPLAPVLDSVVSSSETQIDVAWTPPDDVVGTDPAAGAPGSPAVGHGRIIGYEVDVSDDGKTWSLLATVAGKLDEEYTYDEKTKKVTVKKVDEDTDVEFFHKGLVQGQTKYYRVSTLNNAPSSSKRSVTSAVMNDMTLLSLVSDSPGGLVAKAKDRTSIEIIWNARADDIAAAPIIGYKIESSPLNMAGDDCAEDWSTLVADTMSTTTSYTHMGLMPSTGQCYRVFGINVVATSSGFVGYGDDYVTTNDNDAIATTDPAVLPGMPMNVMATATSDTEITVTWEAPADNGGADITGYMVERGTMGSDGTMTWMAVDPAHSGMMMEYMDTGLMPMTKYYYRVSATNSVGTGEWSDGTAYAMTDTSNTAPTDGPDLTATVTAGATTTVQSTIRDPDMGDTLTWATTTTSTAPTIATATVNATSGMVTISGHMAGSATITVTAMDAAGESATQDIMVTVVAANAAPVATDDPGLVLPNEVSLIVGGDDEVITLTGSFTDPDGDDLTYTAAVMPADGSIATATVSDDGTMLTIAAVSAGMATVTVTASDGNGGTATHDIAVTVSAERRAPANVRFDIVGSGLVNVDWEPVPGAAGYYIVAAENTAGGSVHSAVVNGGDSNLGAIGGLTKDVEYLMYVGAFFTLEEYVLEYQATITAE